MSRQTAAVGDAAAIAQFGDILGRAPLKTNRFH
jgi:hypothetical protein